MEALMRINEVINGIVWDIPAMALILCAGVLLSIVCGFPQFAGFGSILKNLFGRRKRKNGGNRGSVSSFKATCTALAASVGTGNIAGVSGAIAIGGPGAVFWMWVSALIGMCTKFAEVTLAIQYRERNENGEWVGGPMYYIRNGLGERWNWLGQSFCLFGALAAFGIGNMAQINTVAGAVNEAIGGFAATTEAERKMISLVVGIVCALLVFFVLFGGIQRIGDVCALLVPFMAAIYLIAAVAVIVLNASLIPRVLRAIFIGAFDPSAVAGGLTGVGIRTVITKGVGRGIFSNEAGLGSAPIAHAAADVEHPVEQGICGMIEVFVDTIVICTVTALVVLLGVGTENIAYGTDTGAALAIDGFRAAFSGGAPGVIVAVCIMLFALASVFAWGLYGGRCWEFLFGRDSVRLYQLVFSLFAVVGAATKLEIVWSVADTLNGLMMIPNLTALVALSPVVAGLSREYFGGGLQNKKNHRAGGSSL